MPFTFDYIDSLAECWSREKLQAAAKLWPADVNWSWFAGERLKAYDRARGLEVLSICHAHAIKQHLRLRNKPGVQYEWARTAPDPEFFRMMAELGAELDAFEAAAVQPTAAEGK